MGTPSKRYKGTALTVTATKTFPTSASAITFDGIKKVHYDPQISVKKEAADGDISPTAMFVDFLDPMVAFETINPYMTAAIAPGERYTLGYSIADAANGLTTASGGKLWAITNAYLQAAPIDHTFREFGTGAPVFGTISADGTTSPVSVSAL